MLVLALALAVLALVLVLVQASFINSGGKPFGIADGTRWVPAHCDAVLRRHFWFWAQGAYNNSATLNSPAQLLGMHLTSVGPSFPTRVPLSTLLYGQQGY